MWGLRVAMERLGAKVDGNWCCLDHIQHHSCVTNNCLGNHLVSTHTHLLAIAITPGLLSSRSTWQLVVVLASTGIASVQANIVWALRSWCWSLCLFIGKWMQAYTASHMFKLMGQQPYMCLNLQVCASSFEKCGHLHLLEVCSWSPSNHCHFNAGLCTHHSGCHIDGRHTVICTHLAMAMMTVLFIAKTCLLHSSSVGWCIVHALHVWCWSLQHKFNCTYSFHHLDCMSLIGLKILRLHY